MNEEEQKLEKVTNRILINVEEYYEQFKRPIKSSDIVKHHRGLVYHAGLDWGIVEQHMKKEGLVHIRLSESNQKWYFPVKPEFTDDIMTEMVELLEPPKNGNDRQRIR